MSDGSQAPVGPRRSVQAPGDAGPAGPAGGTVVGGDATGATVGDERDPAAQRRRTADGD